MYCVAVTASVAQLPILIDTACYGLLALPHSAPAAPAGAQRSSAQAGRLWYCGVRPKTRYTAVIAADRGPIYTQIARRISVYGNKKKLGQKNNLYLSELFFDIFQNSPCAKKYPTTSRNWQSRKMKYTCSIYWWNYYCLVCMGVWLIGTSSKNTTLGQVVTL